MVVGVGVVKSAELIYALRYCVDEDGGPGYVHLAGRNDKIRRKCSYGLGLHTGCEVASFDAFAECVH
jgi:hypothetical protein